MQQTPAPPAAQARTPDRGAARPRLEGGPPGHGDPFGLADLLSLVRLPLGVLFIFVAARPVAALVVLAAAAFSDMVDGWVARRARPRDAWGPHRGDWLDPLCDKIFLALAMLGLALAHRPPVGIVALALTREWLQVVAFAVFKAVPALRHRPYNYRAHPVGKATTVVQFLAALALLLGSSLVGPLAALAAALGLASVAVYVNRARVAGGSAEA